MPSDEKLTLRPCPVCGNRTALDYLWRTPLVRCPKCSFAYVNQLPTLQELEAFYSSADYFHGKLDYSNYVADKRSTQLHFRHRIAALRQFRSGGELFEAGCAYGFFLELARQYWNVHGIDLSAPAAAYAAAELKLPVQHGDIEHYPLAPNSLDVITMWDTIEHLTDPVGVIAKSAGAVRPGGILALTTGDIDAVLPRFLKKRWRLIIPSHLHYFSRKSMVRLLTDQGFEVVHFSYVSYFRSLRQMAKVITWNKPGVHWRHALLHTIQKMPGMQLPVPLNLYDIMFVIARKPG